MCTLVTPLRGEMPLYDQVVQTFLHTMTELLSQPQHAFATVASDEIPATSGVYVISDETVNRIVYVGRTKNLRRRLLGDHKRGNVEGSQFRKALGRHLELQSEHEISSHIREHCHVQYLEMREFEDTIRLEHFTTAVVAPVLNVKLRQ